MGFSPGEGRGENICSAPNEETGFSLDCVLCHVQQIVSFGRDREQSHDPQPLLFIASQHARLSQMTPDPKFIPIFTTSGKAVSQSPSRMYFNTFHHCRARICRDRLKELTAAKHYIVGQRVLTLKS